MTWLPVTPANFSPPSPPSSSELAPVGFDAIIGGLPCAEFARLWDSSIYQSSRGEPSRHLALAERSVALLAIKVSCRSD
jgi:hypothetical protein